MAYGDFYTAGATPVHPGLLAAVGCCLDGFGNLCLLSWRG